MPKLLITAVAVATVALSDAAAQAVIVLGSQGRNTSAPTGDLADSGWNLQGQYGDFLGTPVAENWFITAAHFGNAGGSIVMSDGSHPLTGASFAIAGTDLILRQVSVPFTTYASIYNPANDAPLTTADQLVVFGRGTDRGAALGTNGYYWGNSDHAQSWGTNTLDGIYTVSPEDVAAGSSFAAGAAFLVADFDNNADPNEATVSVGDSGGGVFIERDGEWKLIGINYGVELFRSSPTGGDLAAAVYDARGLYQQDESGDYAYVDPAGPAVAQQWFASYVPATLGVIVANPIAIPEPAVLGGIAFGGWLLGRRRR
ncbi:MAG: PEP-CTERM sorting domain-containing protein [Tepidisphaeraceae bacterium]